MKSQPFVHLHLHTCYSLLDGACHIDQIMETAVAQGMPAVAITDHGVLYGIIEFYKTARDSGVKPILGCEAYVAEGSRFDRKSEGSKTPLHHLVLLAENTRGYHNLVKLISAAHIEGFYYKPRIDKELLATHHEGLIGLSACLKGETAAALVNDDTKRAMRAAGEYEDMLGKGNFFLEIQDHSLPEERKAAKLLASLAQQNGFPLVATNDVHYLKKEHATAHEVLLCLQTQTVMSDPKRMRYRTPEFYMKTGAEMAALFPDVPGALKATLDIAERCNVELEFGKLHFPTFEAPKGMTQREYLVKLGREGLDRRYGVHNVQRPADPREKAIVDRFNIELQVIEKTGYVNYYLVVWDFVHYARQRGIPVGPGRGSGGGSLLAYVLGITDIDPLEYALIFERFLNPERVSPPDFDIDFCQTRRGEVIRYVKEKYGEANVAQIITFGSLGAKTVIRDVGRVLEIPYAKCDRLSKMVPEDPKITLETALKTNPEFKQTYDTDEECQRILNFGFVLEGLYRNPGTHAAGVVIGERPLTEIIPLSLDKDDQRITQYSMEPLGEIGLLKMDFLGLKTLTVLQEAVELVKETHGVTLDLAHLPIDDKPTYELLNRGDTVGVFQLESGGMRELIRRVGIDGVKDLIAMIALYRPGPMNMLDDYVNRKSGKAKIKYDHPLLEPILEETYGVMVYQEQVQQAANVLAGYTLGGADLLRRAMGKKKPEEMEKQRKTFIEGCAKTNRIPAKQADAIFETMAKFAGYGFNKAHSTGYAIISYQTAYLKANYPAEFMSALISSEIGNFDKLPVFVAEAAEMGLEILPPDVNESGPRFRPVKNRIRFGLAGIKNVGESAAASIVTERGRGGPFGGLLDFCRRIDSQLVNKKVIESLVRCGAFDSAGTDRARLFNGIDFAMAAAAQAVRDQRCGQGNLFDLLGGPAGAGAADELPTCEPWHASQVLAGERELLGIYLTGHPLSQYAAILQKYQLTTVKDLPQLADRTLTRVGGIASQVTKRVTKQSKEMMCVMHLEDLDGCVEVLVFPNAFQKYGAAIAPDKAVLVCGEVSRRDDEPKVIANEIYALEDAPRHFATRLSVHVPAAGAARESLDAIRDILRLHPGGVPVIICLQFPTGEKVFVETDKTLQVVPEESLIHELEQLLGENSVYVAVNPSPCKETRPREWRRNG